jgi:hypothetical protein
MMLAELTSPHRLPGRLRALPIRRTQRLLVNLAVEQPRQAFDEIDAAGLL